MERRYKKVGSPAHARNSTSSTIGLELLQLILAAVQYRGYISNVE